MNRYRELEKLQSATRARIPEAAVAWLAAVRGPLEELTVAALSGTVTDAEFAERVKAFAESLPDLMESMDHDALGKLMEESMGAAMAAGLSARRQKTGRQKTEDLKGKLPWEVEAWLAGRGKGKRCGNSWIPAWKECRVNFGDSLWTGDAKGLHTRAEAEMKAVKTAVQHPESGVEMAVTGDGINKTLHAMRSPEEFMAAAEVVKLFIHSAKVGDGEPDRKGRPEIKAYHKFETKIRIAKKDRTAEITTKELNGDPIHRLKLIRFKR